MVVSLHQTVVVAVVLAEPIVFAVAAVAAVVAASLPPVTFEAAVCMSVAGWAVGRAKSVLLETFAGPWFPFAPVKVCPSFVAASGRKRSHRALNCLRKSFAALLGHLEIGVVATAAFAQRVANPAIGLRIDSL